MAETIRETRLACQQLTEAGMPDELMRKAGSTGETISKTDKSVSGEERPVKRGHHVTVLFEEAP
jgi:hypothetical protein